MYYESTSSPYYLLNSIKYKIANISKHAHAQVVLLNHLLSIDLFMKEYFRISESIEASSKIGSIC